MSVFLAAFEDDGRDNRAWRQWWHKCRDNAPWGFRDPLHVYESIIIFRNTVFVTLHLYLHSRAIYNSEVNNNKSDVDIYETSG